VLLPGDPSIVDDLIDSSGFRRGHLGSVSTPKHFHVDRSIEGQGHLTATATSNTIHKAGCMN
jgi:geranylgeranyl pyrophosphate synthase